MEFKADNIKAILEISRPKQWVKNFFIFAPLIFDRQIHNLEALGLTCLAFLLFCVFSSCVYMINDIADLERDRSHPDKKNRPLPAGRISVQTVALFCIGLFCCGSIIAYALSFRFLVIVWFYIILNVLYSFWLRSAVILDGMIIGIGFVLRIYAGAVVIHINVSDWLYICAIFVSLFLAFAKRRHELILLGDETAQNHRAILKEYSTQLLDQIISIVTAATVVTYSLYCIDSPVNAGVNAPPPQRFDQIHNSVCDLWFIPLLIPSVQQRGRGQSDGSAING